MEYEFLAEFYDDLVNVNYEDIYNFYEVIWDRHGLRPQIVLDLGCGTGNLLPFLEQKYEVIGVDISEEMLGLAREKAAPETLLLQQDMCELDLYGTVDAVVCSLDCINALADAQEVAEALSRINIFLSAGGLLIFDINSPYKFQKILDGSTYVYDTDEVYCVWQSDMLKEEACCLFTLDFFVPDGTGRFLRRREEQVQQIYDVTQMSAIVERSGLELIAVYGDLATQPPEPEEERIYFVARKGKDAPNQG